MPTNSRARSNIENPMDFLLYDRSEEEFVPNSFNHRQVGHIEAIHLFLRCKNTVSKFAVRLAASDDTSSFGKAYAIPVLLANNLKKGPKLLASCSKCMVAPPMVYWIIEDARG